MRCLALFVLVAMLKLAFGAIVLAVVIFIGVAAYLVIQKLVGRGQ